MLGPLEREAELPTRNRNTLTAQNRPLRGLAQGSLPGPRQEAAAKHLPSSRTCPPSPGCARPLASFPRASGLAGRAALEDLRIRRPCQLATSELGHEALSRQGQCSVRRKHAASRALSRPGGAPGQCARGACTGPEAPATPLGVHRPPPPQADAVLTDRSDSLGGKTDNGDSTGSQQAGTLTHGVCLHGCQDNCHL